MAEVPQIQCGMLVASNWYKAYRCNQAHFLWILLKPLWQTNNIAKQYTKTWGRQIGRRSAIGCKLGQIKKKHHRGNAGAITFRVCGRRCYNFKAILRLKWLPGARCDFIMKSIPTPTNLFWREAEKGVSESTATHWELTVIFKGSIWEKYSGKMYRH